MSVRKSLKHVVYGASAAVGGFALARHMSRKALRIICFHGLAQADEHVWNPGLFHHPDTFRRRLRVIRDHGYPVVSLDEGIRRLADGTLPDAAVAITIDDGFYNNLKLAAPILREFGYPATIYVTSYYAQQRAPIFRLAIQYLFWKTTVPTVDFGDPVFAHLGLPPAGRKPIRSDEGRRAIWDFVRHCETKLSEPERGQLSPLVAEYLGVDFGPIADLRIFDLMTAAELKEIAGLPGIDIELHTHRHTIGDVPADIVPEIEENRRVLEPIVGRPLAHFCYPSGVWNPGVWPYLEQLSVRSAVTTDPGLVYSDTPRYGMGRFLDREDTSDLELLAYLAGFARAASAVSAAVWPRRPIRAGTPTGR